MPHIAPLHWSITPLLSMLALLLLMTRIWWSPQITSPNKYLFKTPTQIPWNWNLLLSMLFTLVFQTKEFL